MDRKIGGTIFELIQINSYWYRSHWSYQWDQAGFSGGNRLKEREAGSLAPAAVCLLRQSELCFQDILCLQLSFIPEYNGVVRCRNGSSWASTICEKEAEVTIKMINISQTLRIIRPGYKYKGRQKRPKYIWEKNKKEGVEGRPWLKVLKAAMLLSTFFIIVTEA